MSGTVIGNEHVIKLLERYLDLAKSQPYGSIAISMIARPGLLAHDFAGELTLEKAQLEGLDFLKDKIKQSVANWELPPRDESLDINYVCYSLANGPVGFDFLTWLISMDMFRINQNIEGPLRVGFWMGHGRDGRIGGPIREQWRDNVFKPIVKMLGCIEDDKAIYGHSFPSYTPINIVNLCREGQEVPLLKMTKEFDLPKDVITITLRETEHDPVRNSKLDAWLKFAKDLEAEGEKVVIVRDTRMADTPLGVEICALASRDLDARLWLYEHAKCNFFVANGPSYLGLFGTKPFRTFIRPDEENRRSNNTKLFWRENMGIEIGEQFPWSTDNQRIVWKDDTYENIKEAYNDFKSTPRL